MLGVAELFSPWCALFLLSRRGFFLCRCSIQRVLYLSCVCVCHSYLYSSLSTFLFLALALFYDYFAQFSAGAAKLVIAAKNEEMLPCCFGLYESCQQFFVASLSVARRFLSQCNTVCECDFERLNCVWLGSLE